MEPIPTPRGGDSREAEVSAHREGASHDVHGSADETIVTDARVNLLGMPRAELQAFFVALGEKPYRARQVMKWIYHAGVDDFHAMTDISKSLRTRLDDIAEIRAPEFGPPRRASDGVVKWPVLVGSGQAVEAVLIPDPRRDRFAVAPRIRDANSPTRPLGRADEEGSSRRKTLCISSQVGCALDCSFCATGKRGFNGNLSRAEIVGQVWRAEMAAGDGRMGAGSDDRNITNVVFMGMGEPLLNFDAVVDAAGVLMDDLAFGISKRRVTISTAGVVPRIHDLAAASDVSLAVSLHAARDELRDVLVPLNRRYPIDELLAACRHYGGGLGERRAVTIEYTLIEEVNDTLRDARELADVLAGWRCKINLIPYNPFAEDQHGYRRPSKERVRRFQRFLMEAGYSAMIRATRGDDIGAACGQLTGKVADRTRRRERLLARGAAA